MLPLLTQSLPSHTIPTYDIIVVDEAVMCTNANNCDSVTVVLCCCCCFCYCWILFTGEKLLKFKGGECRTQQKFCIWYVQLWVRCSFDSIWTYTVRPYSWQVGRVQCEENCLVVWWSHFYWFSIFSKDLCFMNAFSLSFTPISVFSLFPPFKMWIQFFLSWIVAGKVLGAPELAIFRYV